MILIQVYIQNESFIDSQMSDPRTTGQVDTYGAWNELDYSLPQFDPKHFVKTTTNAGISSNEKYAWRVEVPNQSQINYLQIKAFPSILFFDVRQNKYIARLEGRPKYRGQVADVLKGLGVPFLNTGPGVTIGKRTKFGLSAAFLLLLLLKKKTVTT